MKKKNAKLLLRRYLDTNSNPIIGGSVSLKIFINSKAVYLDDIDNITVDSDIIIRLIAKYSLNAKETIILLDKLTKTSTIKDLYYTNQCKLVVAESLGFYILANDGCNNILCIDSKTYEIFELLEKDELKQERRNETSFSVFRKELKKLCRVYQ